MCQLDELRALVDRPDVTPAEVEKKLMEIVPTFKRTAYSKPMMQPAGIEFCSADEDGETSPLAAVGR